MYNQNEITYWERSIPNTHLVGSFPPFLGKYNIDLAAMKIATIHVLLRIPCILVVNEFNKCEWLRFPVKERGWGEYERFRIPPSLRCNIIVR
jgi:hypothetical protein